MDSHCSTHFVVVWVFPLQKWVYFFSAMCNQRWKYLWWGKHPIWTTVLLVPKQYILLSKLIPLLQLFVLTSRLSDSLFFLLAHTHLYPYKFFSVGLVISWLVYDKSWHCSNCTASVAVNNFKCHFIESMWLLSSCKKWKTIWSLCWRNISSQNDGEDFNCTEVWANKDVKNLCKEFIWILKHYQSEKWNSKNVFMILSRICGNIYTV
jgi:hypothetical protein